ncbi:4991_t:CDS:2 [Dentiscutata heterogama]|uniref:4991_t:CDS:1 n=1 Tax=Dentiscutata heterogama TaxID=1316150 RepID=A0ACA9K5P3_9GLOM|nr:4991_t:CDS:2 [Dentiscutata heterogama]
MKSMLLKKSDLHSTLPTTIKKKRFRPILEKSGKPTKSIRKRDKLLAILEEELEPIDKDAYTPVKKLRRKRDSSIIDRLASYNTIEDILAMPAN